ncbi:hypothetical protein ABK040_007289 [Willaertia magna]
MKEIAIDFSIKCSLIVVINSCLKSSVYELKVNLSVSVDTKQVIVKDVDVSDEYLLFSGGNEGDRVSKTYTFKNYTLNRDRSAIRIATIAEALLCYVLDVYSQFLSLISTTRMNTAFFFTIVNRNSANEELFDANNVKAEQFDQEEIDFIDVENM